MVLDWGPPGTSKDCSACLLMSSKGHRPGRLPVIPQYTRPPPPPPLQQSIILLKCQSCQGWGTPTWRKPGRAPVWHLPSLLDAPFPCWVAEFLRFVHHFHCSYAICRFSRWNDGGACFWDKSDGLNSRKQSFYCVPPRVRNPQLPQTQRCRLSQPC